MTLSPEAIDRIVANVLNQLGAPAPVSATPEAKSAPAVSVQNKVVTGDLLEAIAVGATVNILPHSIVTPAAQDVVKGRRLNIVRSEVLKKAGETVGKSASESSVKGLLIIVKNTKPLEQLWEELSSSWRRELTGCPDDAAKLAISELARGAASVVVVIAEQTHRAACLANRNEKVKAVAIRDAGDVRLVRKQLRSNTWCLDSNGKTYFELKNIIREIQAK
ncbi:MAG TPA: hypothetical protein VNQ76_04645 [Planctomicrobium sp.]|nr:hypothetical protein [Planctomicrobium sp.]